MLQGIHKIKHIVVIMQENRSFDTYFGTFPGADGIPMKNGVAICVPYPPRTCVSGRFPTTVTSTTVARTATSLRSPM